MISEDEDYENETLTQSVARISNQLSNFSSSLMESSENDIVSKSINSLDFEECRSNDKHSWENDDDGGGGDIYNNQSLCLDIRSDNCFDLSNMDRDTSDIDGDKRYEHGRNAEGRIVNVKESFISSGSRPMRRKTMSRSREGSQYFLKKTQQQSKEIMSNTRKGKSIFRRKQKKTKYMQYSD